MTAVLPVAEDVDSDQVQSLQSARRGPSHSVSCSFLMLVNFLLVFDCRGLDALVAAMSPPSLGGSQTPCLAAIYALMGIAKRSRTFSVRD